MLSFGTEQFAATIELRVSTCASGAALFAPKPKPAPRTGLAPACLVVRKGRV